MGSGSAGAELEGIEEAGTCHDQDQRLGKAGQGDSHGYAPAVVPGT